MKMLKFSCIHEKKRKTKSSDLNTILKMLRGKIKSNKSNFFLKKPKNKGSNQWNRIKNTKREDVLIKCVTSWQVWSIILFSLREDWFLFISWTLLEVNYPQSKEGLRGLVTLFLLTTNLFLVHPYCFSAPT